MKRHGKLIGVVGMVCIVLTLTVGLTQQKQQPPKQPIESGYILLQPGKTYILTFSKPLPVPNPDAKKPPYYHWMPLYVKFEQIQPTRVRFRTLTLSEALEEVRKNNREYPTEQIDPEFIRSEYESGQPWGFLIFKSTPSQQPRDERLLELTFGTASHPARKRAQVVNLHRNRLEVKAGLNRLGTRIFLQASDKSTVAWIAPATCAPSSSEASEGR